MKLLWHPAKLVVFLVPATGFAAKPVATCNPASPSPSLQPLPSGGSANITNANHHTVSAKNFSNTNSTTNTIGTH